MKNILLYLAIFLIVVCMPIRGNETEIRWLWSDTPSIPFVLLCMALACIGSYLFKQEALEKRDDKESAT